MQQARTTQNLFKGDASKITRALLSNPDTVWSGRNLAKRLNLGQSWVNSILNTLEQHRALQRDKQGRDSLSKLVNPKKLLNTWQTQYNIELNQYFPYLELKENPVQKIKTICEKENIHYAITGYAAANLIEKTTYGIFPAMIYLWPGSKEKKDFQELLVKFENQHRLIPVRKQANLILIKPFQNDLVFFESQKRRGINMVSPLQLYLDLCSLERGSETIKALAHFWQQNGLDYVL